MDTLSPELPPTKRNKHAHKPSSSHTHTHTQHKPQSTSHTLSSQSEEDKLKSRYLRHYTRCELITKSIRFSLQNWKMNVYNQLNNFLSQFFSMYGPVYNARLIDAITKQKDADQLYIAFKSYILFLFIKLIATEGMQLFAYLFIRESVFSYRSIIMETIASKDIEFFDLFKTGELVERIKTCESCIENNFLFRTIALLQHICKFIFIAYYLYHYSFSLTLTYVVVFIIKFIYDYILTKFTQYRNHRQRMKNMDMYSNHLNEFITNMRLIKSFSTERDEVAKLRELKLKCTPPLMGIQNFLFKVGEFINNSSETLILFIAGYQTINGAMSYGNLVVFQNYSGQLRNTFRQIQNAFDEYQRQFEGWTRFFEIYDYVPKIISRKNVELQCMEGKIVFDNVSFAYPLKPEVTVLNSLSFTIEPGKVVAIVGHSGSGKTTVSNMLQRFYDPHEGVITIDNVDIRDYNIAWLRRQIGFVAQEPALYSGTIEENITYGVKHYSTERFNEVCKLANVDVFVKDTSLFPDGYKTLVGERGSKVSGGQKQRIAIARALMKDAKVLVFDEATSALDAESENEVQRAIDNVVKEKKITTLIIAHRLCTIKNAGVIMFLSKGRVIEMGTHKELIERDGEYKKLVQRQLVE